MRRPKRFAPATYASKSSSRLEDRFAPTLEQDDDALVKTTDEMQLLRLTVLSVLEHLN